MQVLLPVQNTFLDTVTPISTPISVSPTLSLSLCSASPSLFRRDMATHTIPDTMKAWVVTRRGTPAQAVHLAAAHPVPKQLAKGEVLVRVQAAAFNPVYVPSRFHTPRRSQKCMTEATR